MSNICDRCGGVKNVSYEVEFLPGKRALVQHQSIMMKLCMCPVERIKHDGKLDTKTGQEVTYDDIYLEPGGEIIKGIGIYGNHDYVKLTPKQALSLLAWLHQEEQTLKALAKEQAP